MIITLHDLQHLHYPEFFTDTEIHFRNIYYKKSAEFSERIITSFNHVKNDIATFFNISWDKIDVCPWGMEPSKTINAAEFSAIKKKHDIPDHYLFYSANTWRHKNHINLIKALKIVHRSGNKITLVCAGQKYPDFFPEIEKEINHHRLSRYIKFLGYIPENEMLLIMANAALVVIPTIYEAGSYPLFEAMTYNVPVICSNVTALPDQIGDERFVFDPHSVEQIAGKINLMLEDKRLRQENIANSKKCISSYKWEMKVDAFVESYKKAIDDFKKKKEDGFFEYYITNYEFFINDYYQRAINSLQNSHNLSLNNLIWKMMAPLRKLKRLIKSSTLR